MCKVFLPDCKNHASCFGVDTSVAVRLAATNYQFPK